MTEPDTHTPNRHHIDDGRRNAPVLPRLAERAANDLARPAKAVYDGLRAIDVWFTQHGDPFNALPPAEFAAAAQQHQDICDAISDTLSNAELVARLRGTYAALHTRLQRAARMDRED